MKKRFAIPLLSLSLLAAVSLGANAAETTVEYSVDGSYTVKIPEYLEADKDSKTLEITDAVIPFGQELIISADYDGTLRLEDEPSVTLPYKLLINDGECPSGTVLLRQNAGNTENKLSVNISAKVTEKPIYAGIYRSTVIFDIQVREVTETNYSTEDIDNDTHMFGIGLTKPEYVVARFNDDYSSVVITKNGTDSDGKMMGWNARQSLFSENKGTLKAVIVKEGVVNIGGCAFYECPHLSKIDMPDGISTVGNYAFYGCSALQNIYLSDDIQKLGAYAFSNCKSLESVELPQLIDRIEDGVFSGCGKLVSVTIGDRVTKIGNSSFSSCGSMKNLTLPSSLREIGMWSFRYSGLETMYLPESVTKLGALAFADCKSLTEIHMPSDIAELPDFLLFNCQTLKHIDIPHGVFKIGMQAFSGCDSITDLHIPDNVTNLSPSALSGLGALTAFSVSETHPFLCVEEGVLYNKDKTQLLYFPSAKNTVNFIVPESVTEICGSCFGVCRILKDLYIGNHVTAIDGYMFENVQKPLVHTPKGSAMEQFCTDNNVPYDNIME